MSGFDPTWLALREPYDHAVRDLGLTKTFVEALGPSPRLVDLGCGSGSNLRFLSPHLPASQRWACVDNDPVLLDVLREKQPSGVEAATICLDLAAKLEDIPLEPGIGITAAALLDLTSVTWLDRLAAIGQGYPVLMTLSYDGRMVWDPTDPLDEDILQAFNRHQQSDKGFGSSLGPSAVQYLADRFQEMGCDVSLAHSDWVLAGNDQPIQLAMVDGIAGAAGEIDPTMPIDAWKAGRYQEIEAGRFSLTVGHQDLLSLPE